MMIWVTHLSCHVSISNTLVIIRFIPSFFIRCQRRRMNAHGRTVRGVVIIVVAIGTMATWRWRRWRRRWYRRGWGWSCCGCIRTHVTLWLRSGCVSHNFFIVAAVITTSGIHCVLLRMVKSASHWRSSYRWALGFGMCFLGFLGSWESIEHCNKQQEGGIPAQCFHREENLARLIHNHGGSIFGDFLEIHPYFFHFHLRGFHCTCF